MASTPVWGMPRSKTRRSQAILRTERRDSGGGSMPRRAARLIFDSRRSLTTDRGGRRRRRRVGRGLVGNRLAYADRRQFDFKLQRGYRGQLQSRIAGGYVRTRMDRCCKPGAWCKGEVWRANQVVQPLVLGSPAIDAGDAAFAPPPATDQRGTNSPRKMGAAVDIGAFEFRPVIAVNTTEDTLDSNPGDGISADSGGLCSLRAAISEANSLVGPDEIRLGAATYRLVLHGAEDGNLSGDLDVTDDLTITGQGRANTIIEWDAANPAGTASGPPSLCGVSASPGITIRNGNDTFLGEAFCSITST